MMIHSHPASYVNSQTTATWSCPETNNSNQQEPWLHAWVSGCHLPAAYFIAGVRYINFLVTTSGPRLILVARHCSRERWAIIVATTDLPLCISIPRNKLNTTQRIGTNRQGMIWTGPAQYSKTVSTFRAAPDKDNARCDLPTSPDKAQQ